jgi:hypothetical protein
LHYLAYTVLLAASYVEYLSADLSRESKLDVCLQYVIDVNEIPDECGRRDSGRLSSKTGQN